MNDRLREIRERLEKATRGPWRVGRLDWRESDACVYPVGPGIDSIGSTEPFVIHMQVSNSPRFRHDAAFIAAAPADIDYLLGEVKRLTEKEAYTTKRYTSTCMALSEAQDEVERMRTVYDAAISWYCADDRANTTNFMESGPVIDEIDQDCDDALEFLIDACREAKDATK